MYVIMLVNATSLQFLENELIEAFRDGRMVALNGMISRMRPRLYLYTLFFILVTARYNLVALHFQLKLLFGYPLNTTLVEGILGPVDGVYFLIAQIRFGGMGGNNPITARSLAIIALYRHTAILPSAPKLHKYVIYSTAFLEPLSSLHSIQRQKSKDNTWQHQRS